MDPEILKPIFLRGLRDDCLEHLNIIGKGDISQETFDEIMKLCLRSSRGLVKGKVLVRDPSLRIQKSTSGGVTNAEIENLFKDFKIDLLSTLSAQITMVQVKKVQVEAEAALAILCPRCKRNVWKDNAD